MFFRPAMLVQISNPKMGAMVVVCDDDVLGKEVVVAYEVQCYVSGYGFYPESVFTYAVVNRYSVGSDDVYAAIFPALRPIEHRVYAPGEGPPDGAFNRVSVVAGVVAEATCRAPRVKPTSSRRRTQLPAARKTRAEKLLTAKSPQGS
jgi:hypothetical protein